MFLPMIMGALLLFFGRYLGVAMPDQQAELEQRCAALEQEKTMWLQYVAQMQAMVTTLQGAAVHNKELIEFCLKKSEELLTMERGSYDQIAQLENMLRGKQ